MAQKRRGGFKAPANYDPNRGRAPKRKYGGARDAQASGEQANKRGGSAEAPRSTTNQAGAAPGGPKPIEKRPRVAPVKYEAKLTTAEDAAWQTFEGLGLGQNIVRALGELGAETPFPIQVATIPDAIKGRDILGRAETGSGKTIAFGAALVERMLVLKAHGAFGVQQKPAKQAKRGERVQRGKGAPYPPRNPKAIILAPTRELALQIDRTVQPIARSVGFYTAQLVGGIPIDPQVYALERGVDIVIGTPGRIRDLVERRKLDLREVLVSIVDEADHLCELGFLEETRWR